MRACSAMQARAAPRKVSTTLSSAFRAPKANLRPSVGAPSASRVSRESTPPQKVHIRVTRFAAQATSAPRAQLRRRAMARVARATSAPPARRQRRVPGCATRGTGVRPIRRRQRVLAYAMTATTALLEQSPLRGRVNVRPATIARLAQARRRVMGSAARDTRVPLAQKRLRVWGSAHRATSALLARQRLRAPRHALLVHMASQARVGLRIVRGAPQERLIPSKRRKLAPRAPLVRGPSWRERRRATRAWPGLGEMVRAPVSSALMANTRNQRWPKTPSIRANRARACRHGHSRGVPVGTSAPPLPLHAKKEKATTTTARRLRRMHARCAKKGTSAAQVSPARSVLEARFKTKLGSWSVYRVRPGGSGRSISEQRLRPYALPAVRDGTMRTRHRARRMRASRATRGVAVPNVLARTRMIVRCVRRDFTRQSLDP